MNATRYRATLRTTDAGGRRHTFAIDFDVDHAGAAYRKLGEWAANPALPFDWRNAAELYAEISEVCRGDYAIRALTDDEIALVTPYVKTILDGLKG